MQILQMHILKRYRKGNDMEYIEKLAEVDLFAWLLIGLLLLTAVTSIYKIVSEFCAIFGKPIGWAKQRNKDHDMILENTTAIRELAELHKADTAISNEHDEKLREELGMFMEEVRTDIKAFTDNRINDRARSFEIQKELLDSIQSISDKLDTIQKNTDARFAVSEEKQNQRVQSDIKERIAQSYRRYNIAKKITKMELEALEDLIATYEAHGGENSFVHSVVQKEMYTWSLEDTYMDH